MTPENILLLRETFERKNTGLFQIFSKSFVIQTIALKKTLKHLKITQNISTSTNKIVKKNSKFQKGGGDVREKFPNNHVVFLGCT